MKRDTFSSALLETRRLQADAKLSERGDEHLCAVCSLRAATRPEPEATGRWICERCTYVHWLSKSMPRGVAREIAEAVAAFHEGRE